MPMKPLLSGLVETMMAQAQSNDREHNGLLWWPRKAEAEGLRKARENALEEGREEGKAATAREPLLRLVRLRKLDLAEEQRRQVERLWAGTTPGETARRLSYHHPDRQKRVFDAPPIARACARRNGA